MWVSLNGDENADIYINIDIDSKLNWVSARVCISIELDIFKWNTCIHKVCSFESYCYCFLNIISSRRAIKTTFPKKHPTNSCDKQLRCWYCCWCCVVFKIHEWETKLCQNIHSHWTRRKQSSRTTSGASNGCCCYEWGLIRRWEFLCNGWFVLYVCLLQNRVDSFFFSSF